MRWLKLDDIDDRFEVSEDGRIRYFDGRRYRDRYIMKPKGTSSRAVNRQYVTIGKPGTYKAYAVDSIVAHMFLGIPLGDPVFHKDGDYTNNHYRNLSSESVYVVSTGNSGILNNSTWTTLAVLLPTPGKLVNSNLLIGT